MTDYSKTTNFAAKDGLTTGDSNKIVRGTEIDAEFVNIATAIATKANTANPTFTGTVSFSGATISDGGAVTTVDINGGTIDGVTVGSSTFQASNGSLGAPSYSFSNDTDTGLYLVGPGLLELSVGGTQVMFWQSNNIQLTQPVTISGNLNNYDVDTMWDKLNNIEANADITDATNVAAAGAAMLVQSEVITGSWTFEALPTFDAPVQFNKEIREKVYTSSSTSLALDPVNGVIQHLTPATAPTYTDSIAAGEYVTLMLDVATTVTWPTITWVGGSAPTLDTTNMNIIELWKVGTTLYGAYVGAAS